MTFLSLALGLTSCDSSATGAVNAAEVEAWVAEAKRSCKPNGEALDGVTAGNYVLRDVLVCPDGTLRIVPK